MKKQLITASTIAALAATSALPAFAMDSSALYQKATFSATTDSFTLSLPLGLRGYNPTIEYQRIPVTKTVAKGYNTEINTMKSTFEKCSAEGAKCSQDYLESYAKFYGSQYTDFNDGDWLTLAMTGADGLKVNYTLNTAVFTDSGVYWYRFKDQNNNYRYFTVSVHYDSNKQDVKTSLMPSTLATEEEVPVPDTSAPVEEQPPVEIAETGPADTTMLILAVMAVSGYFYLKGTKKAKR